jgi:hypothetical protein
MRPAYLTGTLAGIVALALAVMLVPLNWSVVPALLAVGAIYGMFGFLTGYLMPRGRWHWGVGLALPLAAIVLVSGSFASGLGGAARGLPLLAGALVGGILGAHFGAATGRTQKSI